MKTAHAEEFRVLTFLTNEDEGKIMEYRLRDGKGFCHEGHAPILIVVGTDGLARITIRHAFFDGAQGECVDIHLGQSEADCIRRNPPGSLADFSCFPPG